MCRGRRRRGSEEERSGEERKGSVKEERKEDKGRGKLNPINPCKFMYHPHFFFFFFNEWCVWYLKPPATMFNFFYRN